MRGVLAAIVRFIIVVGALWPQHAAVQFSVVVASTWASLVALPVATNTDGLRAFHSDASSHLQALNAVSELAARETGIVPGAELHQARNDVGANLSIVRTAIRASERAQALRRGQHGSLQERCEASAVRRGSVCALNAGSKDEL